MLLIDFCRRQREALKILAMKSSPAKPIVFRALILSMLCSCCIGCITPWNTQLPSPYAMDPRIENERFKQFDPFALDDLGPKTDTRPRGYDQPRSRVRRSKEAEYFPGRPTPGVMHAPPDPRTSSRAKQYHQAVPF